MEQLGASASRKIHESSFMSLLITNLTEIARLVPDQVISTSYIDLLYPTDLSQDQSKNINLLLGTIVDWYLLSVKKLLEKNRMMDELVAEKDRMTDALVAHKDWMIAQKDEMIAEKDERIVEKGEAVRLLEKSADIVAAFRELKRAEIGQKWGSVTRSQAWNRLQKAGQIGLKKSIKQQKHPCRDTLASELSAFKEKTWTKELDMYPDLIGAIKDGLYKTTEDIFVMDTHKHHDFHADISVATYDDARFLYFVRYFLEFKLPGTELRTAAFCGQMLDYFNTVREKQPHRRIFIGILSNYFSSWVYKVVFDNDGNDPKIEEYPCPSLADAIIFAEISFASQLQVTIPPLDEALDPKFSILALGKHHFLLSVKMRLALLDEMAPKTLCQAGYANNTSTWFPPVQYQEQFQRNKFVLKITHDNKPLDNEIMILKKLRKDLSCPHIPELVWTRGSGELGILPIGEPVLPGESVTISRNIVRGMIDGLKYLHSQGIIHRDIRLSNLILNRKGNDVNVVIIDYETAFDIKRSHSTTSKNEVEYLGGYICWPRRLLQSGDQLYTPKPADDLFACILVVLHLLFPRRFDTINAGDIQADNSYYQNSETSRVLQMWTDIENSAVWGQFYKAARDEDYDGLLNISEVFCHV